MENKNKFRFLESGRSCARSWRRSDAENRLLGNLGFTKSFIEGVAVFLAQKLYHKGDNFWFGYLNDELRQKWIDHSEKSYESDLFALCSGQYSEEQQVNLLSLNSFSDEDVIKGRRSYYVVSKLLQDNNFSAEDVMELSLTNFRNLIPSY